MKRIKTITNPKFWAHAFKHAERRERAGKPPFTKPLRFAMRNWNQCAVNEGARYRPGVVQFVNPRRTYRSRPVDPVLDQLGGIDFPQAITNQDLSEAKRIYALILDRVHTMYKQSLGVA